MAQRKKLPVAFLSVSEVSDYCVGSGFQKALRSQYTYIVYLMQKYKSLVSIY